MGMGFDHHRAAGGQCADGVGAGDGDREREVAGAKHDHRTHRLEHRSHVGLGQRLACRIAMVDPRVNPRAVAHQSREHARLSDGPSAFALKSRQRNIAVTRFTFSVFAFVHSLQGDVDSSKLAAFNFSQL